MILFEKRISNRGWLSVAAADHSTSSWRFARKVDPVRQHDVDRHNAPTVATR
jgi:hypothetical protein